MNRSRKARAAFFGSSTFAVPSLRRIAAELDLVAVYTQPPSRAGRGRRMRETPIALASRSLGMEPRVPSSLRDAALAEELRSLKLEFGIVASFGGLIPESLLAVPRHGFWNVHPSLLPRWRGAAPVQRAILAGDRRTGVSIMQVVAELDAGPVAASRESEIGPDESAGALVDRLAELGAELLADSLANIGSLTLTRQDPAAVTYAAKISRDDERIDWRQDAVAVLRRIRALSPRPAAWTMLADERLRIHRAEVAHGGGPPGRVLDSALRVACGTGAIRILEAQRPGKRAMPAADMLRGFPVPAGAAFQLAGQSLLCTNHAACE